MGTALIALIGAAAVLAAASIVGLAVSPILKLPEIPLDPDPEPEPEPVYKSEFSRRREDLPRPSREDAAPKKKRLPKKASS